jgi:hypothetical protein
MTAHLSQRSERVSPVPVTSAPTAVPRRRSDQAGDRIIGVFAPELLHRPYLDPRMLEKVNGGYAQRDLDTPVHVVIGDGSGDAFQARAAAPSEWSLLRVSSIASIAIAVFCVLYFGLQLVRGAL